MTTADERVPPDVRCSVLVLRAGSVLLCRREGPGAFWVLPGGTPHKNEGITAAAVREVAEETGLRLSVGRVAMVLETTSWDRDYHRIDIVFLGEERDYGAKPAQLEAGLSPAFLPLDELENIELQPPIAGYIRGFARDRHRLSDSDSSTAAWLGNVWRPETGS